MTQSNRSVPRRHLLKIAGVASVGSLAGCLGDDDDDGNGETPTETPGDETDTPTNGGSYTIGMVDSQTGSLSDFGERNARGRELALATVNEVGIDGRELDIIVEDSQSTAEGGVSAAQKLVNQDGVPFIIGAVGSGVSLAIYDSVVSDTDVVQLSQNSTGLGLTDEPGLLRMSPSGRSQSLALAQMIDEDGYDEVAVTYILDNFGESLANAFVEAYEGDVVYNNSHDSEQASYSGVLSEMNASGADAWLFITYQEEFTTQVNEMWEAGYDPQLYGTDSNRGDTVINNTPEGSMDGMKIVEPAAPVEQENYQDFADRFQNEFGEEPTSWAAFSYDCVITAALSIMAADEFTGSALGDVVRDVTRPPGTQAMTYQEAHDILQDGGTADDLDYHGVSGPIDFDENGDPVGSLVVFEVQDHAYEAIEYRQG